MAVVGRGYACALAAAILAWAATPAAALTSSDVMIGVKQNMHALLIAPDDPGPHPGVLVLHTSGGLEPADIAFARRLAESGYVCLVPSFMAAYGITGRTRAMTFTTDAEPIYADFVQAIGMLRASDKVRGSRIGAVGFSNGAYFAMWLAATNKVEAGISYYGALTGAATDKDLTRFRSVFRKNSSPVLVMHGSDDGTVTVMAANRLSAILAAAGGPHEVNIYDGAGHRFEREPGSERTAADAWQRTLAFFAKYLKSS